MYDRTGHTRPAFHFFVGNSACIVQIEEDFLSLSFKKLLIGNQREMRRTVSGKDFGIFGGGRQIVR